MNKNDAILIWEAYISKIQEISSEIPKEDLIENNLLEEKKRAPRGVCWKGYKMVGKKKKGKKEVPNCVPNK